MDIAKKDCGCEQNVGDLERVISGVAGAVLVFSGLRRRTVTGVALAGLGAGSIYRALSGHCMLYEKLHINTARKPMNHPEDIKVEHTVTIRRPRSELFSYWRKLENLPRIMSGLKSVEVKSPHMSHWVASSPIRDLSWDAEIINEVENELIAWRSTPDSDVSTAGSVRFEDAGDGATHVRVSMAFTPPGGKLGEALAHILGHCPLEQIREDLSRFKSFMESNVGAVTPVPVM